MIISNREIRSEQDDSLYASLKIPCHLLPIIYLEIDIQEHRKLPRHSIRLPIRLPILKLRTIVGAELPRFIIHLNSKELPRHPNSDSAIFL